MGKYSPETKKEKTDRLKKEAQGKNEGKKTDAKKVKQLKFGLHHVTSLVENGQARLVAISHDVDPIELVIHLPALCRVKGIPYCFVKGKARLGALVNQKNATCIAVTDVNQEDATDLKNLEDSCKNLYNDNSGHRRVYGGGIMGVKNRTMMDKRRKIKEEEDKKKATM